MRLETLYRAKKFVCLVRGFLLSLPIVVLLSPCAAWAGPLKVSNAIGSFEFDTTNVGGATAGPVFNNGVLLSPGGGFDQLTTVTSSDVFNNVALPASFFRIGGSGFDFAQTTITAHSTPGGGGIFWLPPTDLFKGTPGVGVINASTASATFTNPSATKAYKGRGGEVLAVFGFVPKGDYFAAAITGELGGQAIPTPPIIAVNGLGATVDQGNVFANVVTQKFDGGYLFKGAAESLLPNITTIAPGGSIQGKVTVTLMGDPGIEIGLALTDPSLIPPGAPLPDFGAFANSAAVPEPSSLFLMGSGLVGLVLAGRKRLFGKRQKAPPDVS